MPDKNKLIVNHLTQARATSPTYGKTGDDFKIACKTFRMDLDRFEPDVIDSAFNEWRHENNEFPHVSDIIKLCTRIQNHRYSWLKQEDLDAKQIESRWAGKKSEEDKQEVAEILKGLYAERDALKKEKRKGGKINYTHWDRHTDEQKEVVMAAVKKSHARLMAESEHRIRTKKNEN
jgi:hypothetical protein